jgi:hypothetical protein
MYSLYQLKNGLTFSSRGKSKQVEKSKYNDDKINNASNTDKSNEFICKNSIFNTNVNSLDTNTLKRKRPEENETDDLSNLNPSIYEEEQRENQSVTSNTKITSKGLSSLKTYNESPVKT